MCSIRALEAHEWELLRDLRLRALRDAPDAFGPTWQDAAGQPDAYWQAAARRFAEAEGADLFLAERDGQGVGLVSALGAGGRGGIGAMWVDPVQRRSGLARRLLETACQALAARGCTCITLTVTRTNRAAIALYESFGFEPTGEVHPLREGSNLDELEMVRRLAGNDAR